MDFEDVQVLTISGYFEIYLTDSKWREESSGYQNETTTYFSVAKKDGKCFSVISTDYNKTMKGHDRSISSVEEIPVQEYTKRKSGKNRMDDVSFCAQKTKRKEAFDKHQKLLKSRPKCPGCKKEMNFKKGPYGYFWGCCSYPRCKRTKQLTVAQKKLVTDIVTIQKKYGGRYVQM